MIIYFNFKLRLFILQYPKIIKHIFTIIWTAGITNSINWIDGLDGLAIGTVGISFIPIFIINFINQNIEESIISIAIIASCISFLRYNFYPSSLLMGDCGSYLLGSNLALFSMNLGINKGFDMQTINSINIYIPLLLTFIPLFDMTRVIFIRLINKRSPFFLIDHTFTFY